MENLKYRYKLKAGLDGFNYLIYNKMNKTILIYAPIFLKSNRGREFDDQVGFTEKEFDELVECFGLAKDKFEKEAIECNQR